MQLAKIAAVLVAALWALSWVARTVLSFRRERAGDQYDAYRALLAKPDPLDLPARGRRYTQAGGMGRDLLKRDLERAYVRHRVMDAGKEEASIVSVRRSALRLVGRRRA